MAEAEFGFFAPHYNRIKQREVDTEKSEGDPAVRRNADAESKDCAPKVQRIARVGVRARNGQDFLFVKMARGRSANP